MNFKSAPYFICLAVILPSCIKPSRNFESYAPPAPTQYCYSDSWAALPFKNDSADAVPLLGDFKDTQKDAKVDVFFIHPTSNFSRKGWNGGINDSKVNQRTDEGSIKNQASVFNGSCKVYAPRYRQATLYSFIDIYGNHPSKNHNGQKALDLAYEDVRSAFTFFLTNYCVDRPFVLASHSQGTWHARRLLKEIIEKDSSLMKRLVAAYIIGGGTEKEEFTVLVPCDSASQTSCFAAWNSMKWKAKDPRLKKEIECVNPISWDRKKTKANPGENSGGVPYKMKRIDRKHVCTQCSPEGLLWTTKPPGSGYLKSLKNYHVADYNLFWMDIRSNVDLRVKTYLEKHK